MTDISLSKQVVPVGLVSTTKTERSTRSNLAYAAFILFCFWVGAQILSLMVHAPGVLEHLAQGNDASRPRIEMGFAVSTVFGLVPFLAGCALVGVICLALKFHQRHYF
ncbi:MULTISPECIES: DUF2755 family protein [Buttiauxella]|jgi:hypothetical protein|nr:MULTISPECIES: DUF2755 family protein [Buttiauxella]AYN27399.1 DUF2755 family protein [Buttiauxella sp. 3AFRM03]MCE0825258.1 YaiY family protein [Buttiauxella ferragutiae]TDN51638.1 uncharacterized protein DUF2755 [Buttiauxella sp. JUb87]UNK60496.1 YaiY family protein [Buttiauxella ferragutiae]